MPPLKNAQKKAAIKETRTPEEIAIQSAANSYRILIPLYDAQHVYFKNPLTNKDHHLSTSSEAFAQMAYELAGKGLQDKIFSDLKFFADNYDVKWNHVIDFLNGYFKAKETNSAN